MAEGGRRRETVRGRPDLVDVYVFAGRNGGAGQGERG